MNYSSYIAARWAVFWFQCVLRILNSLVIFGTAPGTPCFMLAIRTKAMVVDNKGILSTLLHVFIIWCLSIQESVQLPYRNDFDREIEMPGFHSNNSVSSMMRIQLYNSASDRRLRIMEREIDALGNKDDIYARLIFRTNSLDGEVTIQGEESRYYLCINKKAQIVGRKKIKQGSGVNCVFTETSNDGHTELRLVQQTEMHLGFHRDGRAMNARRTRLGGRAVQFLKIPLPEAPEDSEEFINPAWVIKFYEITKQLLQEEEAKTAKANVDS